MELINGTISNESLYSNGETTAVANFSTRPIQPTAPTYVVVTATLFYIIIFIVGIVGNIVVITVIVLSKSMKTSVNIYLLSLCTADLLVMVICMPTALAEIYTMEAWLFGEAMCKLVPFLENTIANASVLTILAISVERYRVISKPLKGIDENIRKVGKIVFTIWIVSSLASSPCISIAVYRQSELVDGTPIMVCRNPIHLCWQRIYIVFLSVFFFLIPCSVLFGLYFRLCGMLMSANKKARNNSYSPRMAYYTDRKQLQGQVFNIIASIVILFFICHLPLRVAGLWFTFEDKYVIYSLGLEKYLNILFSTRIMFYLNHALNPIVYNLVSTKFRCAFKSLCTCKRRQGIIKKRKKSYVFTYKTNTSKENNGKRERVLESKSRLSSSSSSTSSRQKRNDFYGINGKAMKEELYNLNDNSVNNKPNENEMTPSSSSSKGYDVTVAVKENELAVIFCLKKGRKINTVLLSQSHSNDPDRDSNG